MQTFTMTYDGEGPPAPLKKVLYTGSAAVQQGQGFCYDTDFTGSATGEAATDPSAKRMGRVELPSATNNQRFAGVAAQSYAARTGGQHIEIREPGGMAYVLAGVDTVVDTTLLTLSASGADQGRFTFQGFGGRGTALALETDAGVVKHTALDGSATAAYAAAVTTITHTAIGTNSAVGDRLVVLGGADDATGGDATLGEMATAGVYTIVSAPTADTVTIATDIGDVDIVCYVLDNEEHPILAYLFDGEESGLQQFVSPQDAVAVASMVGGVTFVCGGYTMAADSTFTLADGVVNGLKKAFVGMGTLTTKDYKITVTSGLRGDGSTGLASVLIDAADEYLVLEWMGSFADNASGVWLCNQYAGATLG